MIAPLRSSSKWQQASSISPKESARAASGSDEDLLQEVFGIILIRNPAADERFQLATILFPHAFELDGCRRAVKAHETRPARELILEMGACEHFVPARPHFEFYSHPLF